MRRRQFVSLLGGTALAPLTALPVYADPPGDCGIPVVRDDGWPIDSVNDDKLVDRDALCRMADRLVASRANVHAVLVARGDKLVFERYFKGSDEINGRRVENVAFDATALPVYADPPDGCGVPVARDDGWPVVSVNDDKLVDRDALCRMADRLVASSANVHAVLVARGGKLVFERYFKGSDEINGWPGRKRHL